MHTKIPLLVIVGPTAVGKTDTAVLVAQQIDGEIISADSMQIYRGMDIGTAKPSEEERGGIKHHLIDVADPGEEFSVADFQRIARKDIEDIYRRGRFPIVVGGTGLYINSLVYNMDFTETISNPELRENLTTIALERGNEYLHEMLKRADPETAAKLHPNDRRRIIRALEVYQCSGMPMSQYHKNVEMQTIPYDPLMIGLRMNRKELYDRIEKRVDRMMESGLVKEVQGLLDRGCSKDTVSMQGLGYKEIIGYLEGEYSLETAVEILKRDTRRFAKRQFTWFRRDDRIIWMDVENYSSKKEIADKIVDYFKSNFKF
ncbi:MAG: tRNA (adenosine(37)-N6)-dimethylallyltransferase MiaA [Bacillota bacterium]|nr:tRNA (adenosine(37)-N6)-dimethylallyltransferase MiaA [Bacillota bacterium]